MPHGIWRSALRLPIETVKTLHTRVAGDFMAVKGNVPSMRFRNYSANTTQDLSIPGWMRSARSTIKARLIRPATGSREYLRDGSTFLIQTVHVERQIIASRKMTEEQETRVMKAANYCDTGIDAIRDFFWILATGVTISNRSRCWLRMR